MALYITDNFRNSRFMSPNTYSLSLPGCQKSAWTCISNQTHFPVSTRTCSLHFSKWKVHLFSCRSPSMTFILLLLSYPVSGLSTVLLPLPWRCLLNLITSHSTSHTPVLVQATINSSLLWPPCFQPWPIQSIPNRAAGGALPKCTSAYATLLLKSTSGSPFYIQENPIISQAPSFAPFYFSPGFQYMALLLFLEHEECSPTLASANKADICMAHSLNSFKSIVKCHLFRPHLM